MINPFEQGAAKDAVAISYGGGDQNLGATRGPGRALYISSAGNLVVRMTHSATDITLTGLLAGTIYPISVALIRQTNSTAAGLVLY